MTVAPALQTAARELPTPTSVILGLADRAREIDGLVADINDADWQLVEARHAYEIAWARAILTVEGSNADTRKARATLDTESQAHALRVAEHRVQSLKRAIEAKKVRIDVGRTMHVGLRSEWAAS